MGDVGRVEAPHGERSVVVPQAIPDAVTARVAAFTAWLGTVGVAALDDRQRVGLVADLERVKGAASAAQARAVHELRESRERVAPRDVARSVGSEVGLARRESPGAGDRFVRLSRALVTQLPVTMGALTAGECSERHAVVMARATSVLSAGTGPWWTGGWGRCWAGWGWTRPTGPPGGLLRSWTRRRWCTGWRRRSAPAG